MGKAGVTFEQLLAYAADECPPFDRERVAAALEQDAGLRARLDEIRDILACMRRDDGTSPPAETVAKAKAIFQQARGGLGALSGIAQAIARLVFDSRATPALAGFRGLEDSFQLAFECGATTLDLDCEPLGDEPESAWTIIGQIDAPSGVEGCRAALVRREGGEAVAEVVTDQFGVFRMDARCGSYDLRIQTTDAIVVFPNVELS